MMLTLLVAGLVIGCSSEPSRDDFMRQLAIDEFLTPAAPVANLSEKEVIGIARSSDLSGQSKWSIGGCWFTEPYEGNVGTYTYSDFSHTESATFKPSGIWVITAKSSWNWQHGVDKGYTEWPCTYVVDDATGRVTQN
jgi:hypothetical protein